MLIRLLTFRSGAAGEVIDEFLRRSLVPELVRQQGIRHAHIGRIVAEVSSRVVLTVWEGDSPGLAEPLPFEMSDVIAEPRIELAPAAVALSFDASGGAGEEAQIMRVFRGRAQSGQVTAYLDAVREGTLADAAAGQGPLALFVGMFDGDRFMATSIWSSWQRIEEATGGNIRQPVSTRHRELLIDGAAEHFEIVPSTAVSFDQAGGPRAADPGPPRG